MNGDRAHPRSRGENTSTNTGINNSRGSSPLTRGKLCVVSGPGVGGGLIPAHAGKTLLSNGRVADTGAHPRSRGENKTPASALGNAAGSSPLTRGKRYQARRERLPQGLIPAHAGKTVQRQARGALGGAHPRSRGENSVTWEAPARLLGSSPLTRGKRRRCRYWGVLIRLIPAHAGKTMGGVQSTTPRWAHPRSRGENRVPPHTHAATWGSSPLTRGKLRVRLRGC